MDKQYKTEKARLTAIEKAMLSGAYDEAGRLFCEPNNPFLTARILGVAGRFCGLDMVKILVGNGASFDYEWMQYHNSYFYPYHYSLVLSDFFILFLLKGLDRIRGYTPSRKMNDLIDKEGKPLAPICEQERIQVIKYLCEQEDKVCLSGGDYLYYAILTGEKNIADSLRRDGICFSDALKELLTKGGGRENDKWLLYCYFIEELQENALVDVFSALHMEIGEEKRLHFTEKLWEINKQRLMRPEFFAFFLQHFNQSEMNKKKILRELIDNQSVSCLKVVEDCGWLKDIRRRDELIIYASENHKVESAAWLLAFKNRTADLAAEQKSAEKKLMRAFSMTPDSVTELRKLWSYEKGEDGTLTITNYKGKESIVVVPERIGKNIVTAIGEAAFAGAYMKFMMREETIAQHRKITSITLPKTLQKIENHAFCNLPLLCEINIPDSVKQLGKGVFRSCHSLIDFTVPGTVKTIGHDAFLYCKKLERVCICEGVLEIGKNAFLGCSNLAEVILPRSVQKLTSDFSGYYHEGNEIFSGCPKLVIFCPKGSKVEEYCKEKGFSFQYSVE